MVKKLKKNLYLILLRKIYKNKKEPDAEHIALSNIEWETVMLGET